MSCINLPVPGLGFWGSIPVPEFRFTSRTGADTGLPFSEGPKEHPRVLRKPRKRVLVVDDETIVADTVADILNRNGYKAVPVYGGKEALREARAMCPDIVLCDILMPDLNGLEAAKALQQTCPAARIILFSGQAASSNLLERAGAQGHQFEVLAKPIHPRELLRKLAPKQ